MAWGSHPIQVRPYVSARTSVQARAYDTEVGWSRVQQCSGTWLAPSPGPAMLSAPVWSNGFELSSRSLEVLTMQSNLGEQLLCSHLGIKVDTGILVSRTKAKPGHNLAKMITLNNLHCTWQVCMHGLWCRLFT
ncbi:hypothetical protein DAI22_06g025550 [Oryza sativa Japonica Group]|nr:hypothetical protein DAI22_06g025550 [Oryza sativa Japonica Group]